MRLTDKEALKEIKMARSGELEMAIDEYPDDERDGRSDMQMLADELSYILSCYTEDGHVLSDDLNRAREILRETKNGKVIPLWKESLKPIYRPHDIQIARDTINEHRRLVSCMKRLNAKGYYGKW